MDFFAQQDAARRNTRALVLLFIVAVFLLIALTNAAVAAFLYFSQDYNIYSGSRGGLSGYLSFFTWARFGTIGLGVTATVAMVVLVKWMQLSTGGKAVAESMGGARIVPQTRDRAERRCLNVVEEMALAANMPVPAVYVLNDERGINAFAAGITPADAIVAVTRGTIVTLKRRELQGVIAHEFSHILNGDMRLNIRLAALLKGITFIGDVGHFLLRGSSYRPRVSGESSSSGGSALPLLGFALWILGLLGGLIAGFIKAAISRQKEYLADASAVQFTRSTDGIGDALKVIGGYVPGTLVHAARATELSHIFFGQVRHQLWQVFPTHPPLEKRIQRVDPRWDGRYIERKTEVYGSQQSRPGHRDSGVGRAAVVAAAAASIAHNVTDTDWENADAEFDVRDGALEEETSRRESIPLAFVQHSHEPLGAQAIVFSLLLSHDQSTRDQQLARLSAAGIRGLSELTHTLGPGVLALGAPRRLPLLEMCLPALKAMSPKQYRAFKNNLLHLIQADQKTELHEWCLFQLLRHYLDPEYIQVKPSRARYRHLAKVANPLRVTLSVLAHEGGGAGDAVFRLAADELGLTDTQIMPRQEATVSAFSRAVHELADCYPLLKPRILKAMTLAVGDNGVVSHQEREIITSIAAVMDSPVPDLPSVE